MPAPLDKPQAHVRRTFDSSQGACVIALRRTFGVAAGSLLLVGQLVVGAGAALADDGDLLLDVPGDSEGFVRDSSTPVIQEFKLAPGYATSGQLRLRNTASDPATLGLQITDLVDDENGCNRPEAREDATCNGPGELSAWLRATVTRQTENGDTTLWAGRFAELSDGVVFSAVLPAGAIWSLEFKLSLPREAGNEVQSDRIGFNLRWRASQDVTGSTDPEVRGVEAFVPVADGGGGPSDVASNAGVALPSTGSSVGPALLLADFALLLGGGMLIHATRRRRRLVATVARHRRR
jgi:hypothetical protein